MAQAQLEMMSEEPMNEPWSIEGSFQGRSIDPGLALLPEALAQTARLTQLEAAEKLRLNQLRGYAYLCVVEILEQLTVNHAVGQAHEHVQGESARLRLWLHLAREEERHKDLFAWIRRLAEVAIGAPCTPAGGAGELEQLVNSSSPLAQALFVNMNTLVLEEHFRTAFLPVLSGGPGRGLFGGLDPTFTLALHLHWKDEIRHLDLTLHELERRLDEASAGTQQRAARELLEIYTLFDQLLRRQCEKDLATLETVIGRHLPGSTYRELLEHQHRSCREAFLCKGLRHEHFLRLTAKLGADASAHLARVARIFAS